MYIEKINLKMNKDEFKNQLAEFLLICTSPKFLQHTLL